MKKTEKRLQEAIQEGKISLERLGKPLDELQIGILISTTERSFEYKIKI